VGVPYVVLNGVEPGPTLVVTAGVHGTEVVGVGALIEVIRGTDPRILRGCLVAITVANPLAFQVGVYATPYDGLNLATPIFRPPRPAGSITERLAASIAPVIERASHYVDVHANADPAMPLVMIQPSAYREANQRDEMLAMARAWGTTVVDMGDHSPVHPVAAAAELGIPAIMAELTGNMFLREDNVRVGRIGLRNVMRRLGMITGDLEPQPTAPLPGDLLYHGVLAANGAGLLWIRRPAGVFIPRGETVAEVIDVWGRTVEEVRMPIDGYCWALKGRTGSTHTVAQGTPIGYLFRRRG
jgi:predicted deacylase